MPALKYAAIGAAFELLSLSGLPRLIRHFSACRGVIFTLHRILPAPPADFAPNAILQVTPKFLRQAIRRTRAAGFDILSLDEAITRVEAGTEQAPFAVFTFDDAYRDNLQYALPILQEENCPFTLYVPTALVDGVGQVWWQALEDIVAGQSVVVVEGVDGPVYLDSSSLGEKRRTFNQLYARMRQMPEEQRVKQMQELAWRYSIDLDRHCRDLIMTWAELRTFADEPLCTIGAHTVHHYELAKLPADQVKLEILGSIEVLKAQFGVSPSHFSYPIGSRVAAWQREYDLVRTLGLRSAVTTRPGGVYGTHRDHLNALPRISLNGNFQQARYLDTFLTGALFPERPPAATR